MRCCTGLGAEALRRRPLGSAPYRVVHLLGTVQIGGTERMVLEQIRRTSPGRFRAWLGTVGRDGPLLGSARALGAETLPRIPGILGGPAQVLMLARWLRAHRIDLVHLYGLRANVLGRTAARLGGVPAVISAVRNTDDWRKWYHVLVDRATARWVDRWISNSEAGRKVSIAREGIPPSRIVTIRNGVDLSRFSGRQEAVRGRLRASLGVGPAAVLALCVANLRSHKGHGDLLEAMRSLADLNVVLVLVGGNNSGGGVRREIEAQGLSGRVRMLGFQEDVAPYYSAADVLVHASWWEGTPNVILEAMAMELPVVATTVGDVSRLVQDGVTGYLVPVRAPQHLAGSLRRVATHPDLARQFGREGRRRAETEFSMDRMVEHIESVYLEVLEGVGT